jgi:hypothetical protein
MSISNAGTANPSKEKPRGAASRLVRAKVPQPKQASPNTSLRDLAFRGEIPVIKVAKAWYFDRRDLENWIAKHKEQLG